MMSGEEAKAEKAGAAGTLVRAKAGSNRSTMMNDEDGARASGQGDQGSDLAATRARAGSRGDDADGHNKHNSGNIEKQIKPL